MKIIPMIAVARAATLASPLASSLASSVAASLVLSACVTLPEKIRPREQPVELYQGRSCEALTTEQAALSRQLADAEDQQRAAHERDVHVAETLGVLPILGPSQNLKDDIATMKGQLIALAAVGEQKSCRLRKVDLNDPDLRRPKEAAPPG